LLVVLASLAAVALLATGLPAQAHEGAKVGKYLFTVGFGTEPACLGRLNSVQLVLEDAARKSVTDLGDTPQVGVTAESVPGQMRLRLEPNVRVGEFGTRATTGRTSCRPARAATPSGALARSRGSGVDRKGLVASRVTCAVAAVPVLRL
jgi:hypothetical protein